MLTTAIREQSDWSISGIMTSMRCSGTLNAENTKSIFTTCWGDVDVITIFCVLRSRWTTLHSATVDIPCSSGTDSSRKFENNIGWKWRLLTTSLEIWSHSAYDSSGKGLYCGYSWLGYLFCDSASVTPSVYSRKITRVDFPFGITSCSPDDHRDTILEMVYHTLCFHGSTGSPTLAGPRARCTQYSRIQGVLLGRY